MQRCNNCFIATLCLLLLLPLSFLSGTFRDLQTHASHVRRAHFSVEADFYFMPTRLLCDNRHSGLSCWTSRLLFSGPSWVPSSSQGRPLKGCLHIATVYTALLFSKVSFFPACTGALACEGRQIGVWAVTRLLFWKVQTSLGWSRREGDRGMDSECGARC